MVVFLTNNAYICICLHFYGNAITVVVVVDALMVVVVGVAGNGDGCHYYYFKIWDNFGASFFKSKHSKHHEKNILKCSILSGVLISLSSNINLL